MAKWLVTHTTNGEDTHQDIIEADTYEKAYINMLCKSPAHYPTGTICSGIISVIKVPDDCKVPADLSTI